MKYLNKTKNLCLTLCANEIGIIKWYVNASYTIHDDCQGHKGKMTMLGHGAVTSFSGKQKLDKKKNSTKAELIGVDESLPQILWAIYFLESQGYTVDKNILCQDNQSTMIMETNRKNASSKQTKHIIAMYFFMKDRINKKELELPNCPTDQMLINVLTK